MLCGRCATVTLLSPEHTHTHTSGEGHMQRPISYTQLQPEEQRHTHDHLAHAVSSACALRPDTLAPTHASSGRHMTHCIRPYRYLADLWCARTGG